jgi:glyoxylase-like metal-dependent hydrolase (beta-lactamase superfamily II)
MRLIGPVYLVGGQDFNMVYLDWPANDCNTYLVDTGDPLCLIDCGCGESLSGILANIWQMDFDPKDISHVFLTHAHLPHSGAAEPLRLNGVKVLASPATAQAVKAGSLQTAAYHYHRRFLSVAEVTEMVDGERIVLGACEIRAVYLPGHSAGCTGYELLHDGKRLLFCGDAVRSPSLEQFRNRPDYDRQAYAGTLTKLLADAPHVLYPGHGPFCLSNTEQWIGEEMKKLLAAPR